MRLPRLRLRAWPPRLRSVRVAWFGRGDAPATLTHLACTAIAVRVRAAVFALPLLADVDLGRCDMRGFRNDALGAPDHSACAIESLRLRECSMDNASFAAVCRLLNPATLTLLDIGENDNIGDLSPLSALTRLETFHMPGLLTHLTPVYLTMSTLTSLDLGSARFGDDFASLLRSCPRSLHHVRLPRMWQCIHGAHPDHDGRDPHSHPISALSDIGRVLETLGALTSIDMSGVRLHGSARPAREIVRRQLGRRLAAMVSEEALPHFSAACRVSDLGRVVVRAFGDGGADAVRLIGASAKDTLRGCAGWLVFLIIVIVACQWCGWLMR